MSARTPALHIPLMVFLCLAPLQWVNITSTGPVAISLAHLGLFIPPCAILLSRSFQFPAHSLSLLFLAHPIMFLILLISLPYSQEQQAGASIIIRMFGYYLFGVIIFMWLYSLRMADILQTLSRALFYVVPVFVICFGYYLIISDTNIIVVLKNALNSGQPNYIQHFLFLKVFNSGNLQDLAQGDRISSAGRHGIMSFLVILFFARLLIPRINETRWSIVLGRIMMGFIAVVVLISLSRVALLIFGFGLVLFGMYKLSHRSLNLVAYTLTALAVMLGLVYVLMSGAGALGDIVYNKLILDVVNNTRVYEYAFTLTQINQNAIWGHGVGTPLGFAETKAQFSHNIVFFWWHQAGLLGFASAVLALILFLYTCVRLWMMSLSQAPTAALYALASILLIPSICRMLVAAQGAMALTEWVAVAMAIAISVKCQKGLIQMSPNKRGQI